LNFLWGSTRLGLVSPKRSLRLSGELGFSHILIALAALSLAVLAYAG
jgi:hypothetical protein